jgi:thiamine-phosphate pyrophosphorylase
MMRRIFLVSDRRLRTDRPIVRLLEEAAAAGVDRIQLREKDLPDRELLALARDAVAAVRPHGCRFYVNGRFDIALEVGADGVHLPSDGLSVQTVRSAIGRRLDIGVSTHSIVEARAAQEAGADYVYLGPIFPTPSKEQLGEPLGVELLAQAVKTLEVPVYAIGGIDRDTAMQLRDISIAGVALIRGLLAEPDIPAAVGVLRERLSPLADATPPGVEEEGELDDEDDEQDGNEEEDEDEDEDEDQGGWGIA